MPLFEVAIIEKPTKKEAEEGASERLVFGPKAVRVVHPIHDRIVVWPIEEMDLSTGGIVIPDNARAVPSRGVVLAVGSGKLLDSGSFVPLDVKVGETVLYGRFQGTGIEVDGQEYLMLREDDVLAVVEG